MDTQHLIDTLIDNSRPVQRLPRPWVRCALWLAIAVPYLALIVVMMSPRPDLATKFAESRFLIEQLAALATAVTAAIAAFAATVPGYNRKVLLLPVIPLAVWLGVLGQGCISTWLHLGSAGLSLQSDWICLPAIALAGAVPAIAMVVMLRRGAPMMPYLTVALGALASAGLGNFALRLFHAQDASLMVLVWQFGSVFLLAASATYAGPYLLNWRSVVTNRSV
ncbi:MAG: DUF1109 domain-containing protein [Proteobacteria bacterium]|nr:DUF1109 domain-containing protein [Pseudomonadota bacterium]